MGEGQDSRRIRWSDSRSALPFALLALLIFELSFFFPRTPEIVTVPKAMIGLIAVIVFSEALLTIRHYGQRGWMIPSPISIIFALTSTTYTSTVREPDFCSPGIQGAGFPFPWMYSLVPYTGPKVSLPCILVVGTTSSLDSINFIIDAAFFLTLIVAAIEVYRGLRHIRIILLEGQTRGASSSRISLRRVVTRSRKR